MMKNNHNKDRFTVLFSVAVISALLLLVSLPQNTTGKEELSEWTDSSGVRENNTIYRYADPGGPSLEFYQNNSYIEQPPDLWIGTEPIGWQIDFDVLMGSVFNTLNFYWNTTTNHTTWVAINGNGTVSITAIEHHSSWWTWFSFIGGGLQYIIESWEVNTWQHITITIKSTTTTVKINGNSFTENIETTLNPYGMMFFVNSTMVINDTPVWSVFLDNIQTSPVFSEWSWITGWYEQVVGSEYFPIALLLVFGVIVIAVVKGMVIK